MSAVIAVAITPRHSAADHCLCNATLNVPSSIGRPLSYIWYVHGAILCACGAYESLAAGAFQDREMSSNCHDNRAIKPLPPPPLPHSARGSLTPEYFTRHHPSRQQTRKSTWKSRLQLERAGKDKGKEREREGGDKEIHRCKQIERENISRVRFSTQCFACVLRGNSSDTECTVSTCTPVQTDRRRIDSRIIAASNNRRSTAHSGDTSASPSVSSQTNEASKLGADKHREMAVSEVPLIANGPWLLKLARERQSARRRQT